MQLITPYQRFELNHHEKNLIYLDTEQDANNETKDFNSNKKLNLSPT